VHWNRQAKCVGGLAIDYEKEFRRLLNRQVGGASGSDDNDAAHPMVLSSLVSIAETLRPPVQRYSPMAKLHCADINHARASRGEVRTLNERLTFLHNR
jgi:hypothetical protein